MEHYGVSSSLSEGGVEDAMRFLAPTDVAWPDEVFGTDKGAIELRESTDLFSKRYTARPNREPPTHASGIATIELPDMMVSSIKYSRNMCLPRLLSNRKYQNNSCYLPRRFAVV